jgi:cation-transporting ATPase E
MVITPAPHPMQGLSEAEVLARRARGQGNNVPIRTGRTYAQILLENVFTFINYVLFGLGIALALLGQIGDALVSLAVVTANLLVSVTQEVRAKRILDRIALLTRPTAAVIRDGRERRVDPSEIVLGDVLVLVPGDQVVVDGRIVGEGRVDLDESLLTGESDPVPKTTGDPVYSGSFCISGSAHYEAERVGAGSLANQLTVGATAFRRVYTPLQREINRVVRVVLVLVIFIEVLVVIAALIDQTSVVRSVKMSMVIAGLVPQGLFLAITAAYAMGAVRIARRGALVQQANAVESLSNVDVLCLDKTGTLTTNRLRLHAVRALTVSEADVRQLLGDYVANVSTPNRTSEAIHAGFDGKRRDVLEEVPFSSDRQWSALILGDGPTRGTYILGAPEVLRPHLHIVPQALRAQADAWTASGLRVLLLAGRSDAVPLYDAAGKPVLPRDLIPLGLVSLSDELRPDTRETLRSFAEAGVQLKIISGDHPLTVLALATQAGFDPESRVASGLDLERLDKARLAEIVSGTVIFGRVAPRQKEELVQILRSQDHYVAMIGDGVNDVLSMKRADLAIAVASGSQATRSVADLILLDDSFAVLPDVFREGQRIVNGMRDIFKLYLVRVFTVALLIVSVAVIGAGFPLTPRTNALLTLFTVGIPTIALAAWARPEAMPRHGMVRSALHFVLTPSLTLTLVGLGVYFAYFASNLVHLDLLPPQTGRVVAFETAELFAQTALTIVLVSCGLLLVVFAEPPTPVWTGGDTLSGDWRPTLLALLLLLAFVAILAIPPLRDFFDLAPLRTLDYVILGLVTIVWAIFQRWIWRERLLDRFLGVDLEESAGR